jgi:RNA polymerase sigma-70 factor (ECF subfamily)
LVAKAGGHPKLDQYAAGGRLRGLVQVVAVREAISLLRKHKRAPHDDDLTALASPEHDPELRYLAAQYRAAFSQAFEAAVRKLTSRERNFLRLQSQAGMNVEQIAAMYNVHRATATRWLTKIREQLLAETQRGLAAELAISTRELESVMRLIQDNLDISVQRMLQTINEQAPPATSRDDSPG